ncbi:MAG: pyruvate formate-lyase-activating protein [Candidatus Falkowbacteria bacterium]
MKIHSIETFGTHEGPGIRLVIFLQGCNLACAYCHNPDTISLVGGREVSSLEIIQLLLEQAPYFTGGGGLTVSGGEPTLQAVELIELFTEAKKKNFHTALDTNGTILTTSTKELLSLTDLVLIDLKHFDSAWCQKLTGQGNETVLKMIEFREQSQKPFWIRYVLVPGWTDQAESLEAMAKYLSQFKYLKRLEILPYHNLGVHKYKELGLEYRLTDVKPASAADVNLAVQILKKYLPEEIIKA